MSSFAVQIDGVSKRFKGIAKQAIQEVSARFSQGQIIGIVGPDGAGKTTLLRILAGLIKPCSGSIDILGIDAIKKSDAVHKRVGYMPQRFGLYEDLTVMQNLALYADLQGVEKGDREKRFSDLLGFSGLSPFTNRLAKDLSGGMKQKLGLSCVLLGRPELLLLDEPTVGVDPLSRRQLWAMAEELASGNTTILWSTCYLDEAQRCAEVLLLREGSALYCGPPQEYTQIAAGKVFTFCCEKQRKREVVQKLYKSPHVVDASVQGDRLRVVVEKVDAIASMQGAEGVSPRFEDAFILSLSAKERKKAKPLHIELSETHKDAPVIEAKGLCKSFKQFKAVNSIAFEVKSREIFGLLGPNGAGKSTTFKMLCGLMQPSSGTAAVMGVSLQSASALARSQIGYMAQKFSLYSELTVRQNLTFFSTVYPVPRRERTHVIDEMISTFELEPFISVAAGELPLGFKQRLSLACTLMHRPKILFLDEPTSGVDPLTRREFWHHINHLVDGGMTVMITTHFMEEAEYCDRIGLINQGRLIMLGTPEELKSQVQDEEHPHPTLEDAFIFLSQQNGGYAVDK